MYHILTSKSFGGPLLDSCAMAKLGWPKNDTNEPLVLNCIFGT